MNRFPQRDDDISSTRNTDSPRRNNEKKSPQRKRNRALSASAIGGVAILAVGAVLAARAQTQNASTPNAATPNSARAKAIVFPDEPRIIEPPIRAPWPIPIPRPWPTPSLSQSELQLVSQRAQIDISGATARTKLVQTFRNPTQNTIEGTYLFPLPSGAAVSDFAMTVGGKRVAAEILEAGKAREIYEEIVRKRRDPALLEFTDRNTLRARIFPIAAGAEQQVEIEYSQALVGENAALRYSLPLRLPVGGAAQNAAVEIRVRDAKNVRSVYSPTHKIETSKSGDDLKISGEWNTSQSGETRDFVLYLTQSAARVGVDLVTQKVAGEDGYFMLLAAPDSALNAREIAAKDVVFTFDTSGSMEGAKIEQARKALLSLLGNLNADDRFNIVTFSSDVNTFRPAMVASSTRNVEAARQFVREIKAVGGTNIDEALQTSLKMFAPHSTRPQQLIFLTDGQPTVGETDIETILKNARDKNSASNLESGAPGVWTREVREPRARIFDFGVGFDVNTKLLDALSEENRGAVDYVLPSEDIEAKVGALYNKIAFPVLSDAQMNWGGADVYDVYPRQIPDLFKGAQVVLFGRFRGESSTRIALSGTRNGQKETIEANGVLRANSSDNELLPCLWATRKIGFLLDDARRKGVAPAGEVRDEIIALSKKYGVVTPLTAALISEDETPPLFDTRRAFPNDSMNGSRSDSATARLQAGAAYNATSGAEAVRAAKATSKMRDSARLEAPESGDAARDKAQNPTRFVAGKTFVQRDGIWTDSAFDTKNAAKIETIKFASDAYFALAKDTTTAKWLSVGNRVLVVLGKRIVKIEP